MKKWKWRLGPEGQLLGRHLDKPLVSVHNSKPIVRYTYADGDYDDYEVTSAQWEHLRGLINDKQAKAGVAEGTTEAATIEKGPGETT